MTDQDSNDDSIDNSNLNRYKIIFLGDIGVGKTAIINRIFDKPFEDVYDPSIAVDFMTKTIKFQGQNIKVQLWDTSGKKYLKV